MEEVRIGLKTIKREQRRMGVGQYAQMSRASRLNCNSCIVVSDLDEMDVGTADTVVELENKPQPSVAATTHDAVREDILMWDRASWLVTDTIVGK